MYFPDYNKAMQNSRSNFYLTGTGTSGAAMQIVQSNENRLMLGFCLSVGGAAALRPNAAPANINDGWKLSLVAGGINFMFVNIRDHGDLVRQPWWAFENTASWTIAIWEAIGSPDDSVQISSNPYPPGFGGPTL